MNAKDLRLGNYFQSNIIQQVQIEHLEFLLNDKFDHSVMQPIPLSEEWLQKMGFSTTTYSEVGMYTVKNKSGKYYFCCDYIGREFQYEIQFVHQLQNIFQSLTGEELTIKEL